MEIELLHVINKLPEPVARFYHFFPFVRAGLLNSISPDILKLGELRQLDETGGRHYYSYYYYYD